MCGGQYLPGLRPKILLPENPDQQSYADQGLQKKGSPSFHRENSEAPLVADCFRRTQRFVLKETGEEMPSRPSLRFFPREFPLEYFHAIRASRVACSRRRPSSCAIFLAASVLAIPKTNLLRLLLFCSRPGREPFLRAALAMLRQRHSTDIWTALDSRVVQRVAAGLLPHRDIRH